MPGPPIVGRADEIAHACSVVVAERGPTLVLLGPPGIGKTATARVDALRAECGEVRIPLLDTVVRPLTEREHLVARLAASGRSNAEIAERLGTSSRTVGNQLQSVYQKLGLHSREELRFLAQ